MADQMLIRLRSFHRSCCRGITGDFIRQGDEGEWIYPSSEVVLENAGVRPIEEYIQRRRNSILPYALSREIYGRCTSTKRIGSNLLWWEANYYSYDAAEAREGLAADGAH